MRTPEDAAFEVTKRIRDCRQAAGVSTRELGEQAGMSHALISSIESGKARSLTVVQVCKLADALGVSRRWLLLGEGDMSVPASKPVKIDLDPPIGEGLLLMLGGDPEELIELSAAGRVVFTGRRGALTVTTQHGLIAPALKSRRDATTGQLYWGVP